MVSTQLILFQEKSHWADELQERTMISRTLSPRSRIPWLYNHIHDVIFFVCRMASTIKLSSTEGCIHNVHQINFLAGSVRNHPICVSAARFLYLCSKLLKEDIIASVFQFTNILLDKEAKVTSQICFSALFCTGCLIDSLSGKFTISDQMIKKVMKLYRNRELNIQVCYGCFN